MPSLWRSVREGAWLAWAVVRCIAEDRLYLWVVARWRKIPLQVADLTPAAMSIFMDRRIDGVVADGEKARQSEQCEIGAGGTGTARSWLRLSTSSGADARVFVKLPASTFFERVFLTVFGVYKNELGFYRALRDDAALAKKLSAVSFAKAHAAEAVFGGRFVLVLEDLAERGAEFPTVASKHPRPRVEAVLRSLANLHAPFFGRPPPHVWTDASRPPFLRIISDETLKNVLKRFPGLLPPLVLETYELFLANYEAVRRHWSEGVLTLVHGDAHLGNMFFANGAVGFYDLQCVAAEHPFRDVAYHLCSSCDSDDLALNEQHYVSYYVSQLNAAAGLQVLTFEAAWAAYRIHALWACCAFVLCSGASELFESKMAKLTIRRICAAMVRLDTRGALDDVLAAQRAETAKDKGIEPPDVRAAGAERGTIP
ncbi:kinase-like domain-containing protein [Pelagophyceae sp. CCMP2097]|nr:kinase-like domain-containing protein [Pelagophyceae sp. CCMP2097]